MPSRKLVVVGNGLAATRFVEEFVRQGGLNRFDVTVYGEEPGGAYNRILLSSVLAGGHAPADIYMTRPEWYRQTGVRFHDGVRVLQIDRTLREVYGAGQTVEPYDKLVLATGSGAFVPGFAAPDRETGAMRPGVFVFRSLADCEAIVAHAAGVRSVAVIGGGLLGLEAAYGLAQRGLQVHIVHLMDHLMEVQLDLESSQMLQGEVEALGVQVHLEKSTTAILGDDGVTGLAFADGSTLACDMVVVAAGVRPNTDLAKACGLNVERGVVVHDDLSCRNDPDVYAIGDCAQHRGRAYGLVAPAWEQAAVVAQNLADTSAHVRYPGTRVATKLKIMGVDLSVMGDKEGADGDETVLYREPSRAIYKKLVVRDGRLAGAILLGDGMASPRVLQAYERDEVLPEARSQVLFTAGTGAALQVTDLPDSATLCQCNGVSKGGIVQAIVGGAHTVKGVGVATRAGTGCGSCRFQIQALIEAHRSAATAGDAVAAG